MQTDVNEILRKRLAKAIASEIDIEALAKSLAPKIRKALTKALLDSAKKTRMDDLLWESMDGSTYKALGEVVAKALRKLR